MQTTKNRVELIQISETRHNELEKLSRILDIPTSVLIRMGISLILKKYKDKLNAIV
jgi:hypothetical protein